MCKRFVVTLVLVVALSVFVRNAPRGRRKVGHRA